MPERGKAGHARDKFGRPEVVWGRTIVRTHVPAARLHLPPNGTGRGIDPPADAVALQRRPVDRGVPHGPGPRARVAARAAHAGARRHGPRRRGDDLRRLAELRRRLLRAHGPRARAVQGSLRGGPLHVQRHRLQPLRLHLGGQGLRHGARAFPGLPEEARQHLADPSGHRRQGRPPAGAWREVRRHRRLPRPPHRRHAGHPARAQRHQRLRQRPPDGAQPLHAAHRGRPRRLQRVAHDERPRRGAGPGLAGRRRDRAPPQPSGGGRPARGPRGPRWLLPQRRHHIRRRHDPGGLLT